MTSLNLLSFLLATLDFQPAAQLVLQTFLLRRCAVEPGCQLIEYLAVRSIEIVELDQHRLRRIHPDLDAHPGQVLVFRVIFLQRQEAGDLRDLEFAYGRLVGADIHREHGGAHRAI